MNSSNIKILVCAHKADFCKSDDIYLPIHVGKSLSDIDLGYIGDNTGDNISEKNRSFCELTGMYWAWKNVKDVDYIGLAHYRRYFKLKNIGFFDRDLISLSENKVNALANDRIDIISLFEKYDIILPKRKIFITSIRNLWKGMHNIKDLEIIEEIIKELYPEYKKALSKTLKSNKASQYNMFIMKWSEFNTYCEWVFNILFEAEKRIDISGYDVSHQRVFGFLSEHLINVYIEHNKLKKLHVPVIFVSNEKDSKSLIRYYGSQLKSQLRYIFNI